MSVASPLLDVDVRAKRFGTRLLLEDARLGVASGEVVSLVGPSGCGKSTLLRIVAGLDRDYTGSVTLEGVIQRGPSAQLGVIFQEPRLLPWLSVADNVSFPQRSRGAAGERVARLLEETGLAGIGHLWPKQLSGGMAQRVALARGLFTQPRLLLLDEPFSAVDEITRMRLQELLLTLTRTHRMAALIVTHDLDEALFVSDRVLLMAAAKPQRPAHIARTFNLAAPQPRKRGDPLDAPLRAELFASLAALVPA